jgi:hypothetical protein
MYKNILVENLEEKWPFGKQGRECKCNNKIYCKKLAEAGLD